MTTIYEMGGQPCTGYLEIACLSTDEKPIGRCQGIPIGNGSRLYIMDKPEIYMYDEEHHKWLLQ